MNTVETSELLKYRGVMKYPDMAKKFGLTVPQIRHRFNRLGLPPLQAGPPKKPYNERTVNLSFCIKRKHFAEADQEIRELLKKYKS